MLVRLSNTKVSARLKTLERDADDVLEYLEGVDGVVRAVQATTDQFDIPPSVVLAVTVDLEELDR